MSDTSYRDPQNRLKNWTGTVHWAVDGKPACGKVATHSSYLKPSVATVNCNRCIAIHGGDVAGYVDPPLVQEHVARREAERAARRAARKSMLSPLNEQAKAAVDKLFAEFSVMAVDDARVVTALVWLDGYEQGAKATKAKADAAFAEWQAAQS